MALVTTLVDSVLPSMMSNIALARVPALLWANTKLAISIAKELRLFSTMYARSPLVVNRVHVPGCLSLPIICTKSAHSTNELAIETNIRTTCLNKPFDAPCGPHETAGGFASELVLLAEQSGATMRCTPDGAASHHPQRVLIRPVDSPPALLPNACPLVTRWPPLRQLHPQRARS
jgi:hypothetical protein